MEAGLATPTPVAARLGAVLLFAAIVLSAAAWTRGPEYDEAYSLFLTAGDARPAWPSGVFRPGDVRAFYASHAGLRQIAHDLRAGDVHPPLYFWALELWRRVFGPSWFAARTLSVLCAVAALGALGRLAALAEIPVAPAMLVALLGYGFAYTGIIARDFALAQLFNLVGVACILAAGRDRRRRLGLAAGLAFGAASGTNYLAVFTGLAGLLWLALGRSRRRCLPPALLGLVLFLPLDAWFFIAQRSSRAGQFATFSWRHALPLLAKDAGAALFGGLPLYAGALAPAVTLALAALACLCVIFIVRAWRPAFLLFALAAAATPAGLLALGVVFHNTPIEIRYLAFSTPFVALLCAAALPRPWLAVLLAVEAGAVIGLAFAATTMQPQGPAARAAAALATPRTLVLVPFGNDGVGVPGPFVAAAPGNLRIALFGTDQNGSLGNGRLAAPAATLLQEPQLILALAAADNASRATIAEAEAAFARDPCWQPRKHAPLVALYLNRCAHQQP